MHKYGEYQYSSTYTNLALLQGKNLRYKFDKRLGGLNSQLVHSDKENIFLLLLRIKHQLLMKHTVSKYFLYFSPQHIFSLESSTCTP
jgi:hypothetical protein